MLQNISVLNIYMFIEKYPCRKGSLARLPRSQSQVINPHVHSPRNKKISNHKIRRRSLMPKNVRLIQQGFNSAPSQHKEATTELRFLAQIVKKKQEPMLTNPTQYQISAPKLAVEYHYYDNIVRNLITEIRSRSTKQGVAPPSIPKINKIASTEPIKLKSPIKDKAPVIKMNLGRDKMVFGMSHSGADTIYEKKITSFLEFLYKINFSNCIYVDLSLSKPKTVYKVKVGIGNNGALVKSLIKRRFWLEIVNNGEYHFSWTQLTDNLAHENQAITQKVTQHPNHRFISKKPKLLQSSSNEQLRKILRKQQIGITNQWYQRSDCGKLSCYPSCDIKRVSNHIPLNCIIGAKRILFRVIDWYYRQILDKDPFTVLPKTYSFEGDYTEIFKRFTADVDKFDKIWIVKPGQNTNRGNGILVMQTKEVFAHLARERGKEGRPLIVQEYIKPFLYNGRKFDIRHFLLLTSVNGYIRAYWYHQGYLRTSSQKYDIEDLSDQMIHLTNDAVQKKGEKYGKYQPANKLSYSNFQRYLDTTYPHKHYNFETQILQKMKQITTDLIRGSFQFMDPSRKCHNFELYGLDFYVSSKFKPYLIECNANPCLQVNCPILERIIPGAVQHGLRIGLDPLLPPPSHYPPAARYHLCDRTIDKLKYELIFDEKIEGSLIRDLSRKCAPLDLSGTGLKPEEDVFQDDGSELDQRANLD